jgi:DNA modification methylase
MEIINEKYAIYNGDCIEKMQTIPSESIDISIYSPPFSNMYTYSADDRDLSNCANYNEFLEHYTFVIKEVNRILKKGRIVAVHCMDIPQQGQKGLIDLPADIIRLHKENGFVYWDKKTIWKDPLMIAIRTRQQALKHGQLVKDSTHCRGALPDYVIIFKKVGENETPVNHPQGLTDYAGDVDLMNIIEKEEYNMLKNKYIDYIDDKTNKLSQFIWKRYADCMWEDIRPDMFLEYKAARDPDDERHLTPTSLDIIERIITLYSNENEILFTPFMGVGSEVYGAVKNKRKGLGIELKESYFRQSVKNLESLNIVVNEQIKLF